MRTFHYSIVEQNFQEEREEKIMIKFEKITESQYLKDYINKIEDCANKASSVYREIVLPRRSTKGSAGYDFFAPYDFVLRPGEQITVLTGIKVLMPYGVVLIIAPRSGQGIRYKLQLMNTLGVIDADYSEAENEGHIMIALFNDSPNGAHLEVKKGQAFAQGVFLPYYLTDEDKACEQRTGGFGSTDDR